MPSNVAGVCCAGLDAETGTCCQDDDTFDNGFGECFTYVGGGANDGYCREDGACDACGCSCAGECSIEEAGSGMSGSGAGTGSGQVALE